MEIYFEKADQTKKLKFDGKVLDLLRKLDINPVTVVIVKNRTIITEQDKIKDSDKIKLLSVVSGG
ncbi:MAG: MoaD/ThiS family protein [Candidatus Woesearchaeota archaeon]